MTVEQTNVVDFLMLDSEPKSYTLVVSDHLEWGCDQHLTLLQEKLNAYLHYVESGEILEEKPEVFGKAPRFLVYCKHKPDHDGIIFLENVVKFLQDAGILFEYEVHDDTEKFQELKTAN